MMMKDITTMNLKTLNTSWLLMKGSRGPERDGTEGQIKMVERRHQSVTEDRNRVQFKALF